MAQRSCSARSGSPFRYTPARIISRSDTSHSPGGVRVDFHMLLRFAVDNDASDVHIQAGLPPCLRIGGILRSTAEAPLTDDSVKSFIASIAPPRLRDNIDERLAHGLDFSYAPPDLTRFRCSAYRH